MRTCNVAVSVLLAVLLVLVSPAVARMALAGPVDAAPETVLPLGDDLQGSDLLDVQGEAWRAFVKLNVKAFYLFFLYKALDAAWAHARSQPRASGNAFSNGHVGGGQGGGGGGTW